MPSEDKTPEEIAQYHCQCAAGFWERVAARGPVACYSDVPGEESKVILNSHPVIGDIMQEMNVRLSNYMNNNLRYSLERFVQQTIDDFAAYIIHGPEGIVVKATGRKIIKQHCTKEQVIEMTGFLFAYEA